MERDEWCFIGDKKPRDGIAIVGETFRFDGESWAIEPL
jgi:hypothetical protein